MMLTKTLMPAAAGAMVLLGVLAWITFDDWRWAVTGLLAMFTVAAFGAAIDQKSTITSAIGVCGLAAGVAAWMWTSNWQWAIAGAAVLLVAAPLGHSLSRRSQQG